MEQLRGAKALMEGGENRRSGPHHGSHLKSLQEVGKKLFKCQGDRTILGRVHTQPPEIPRPCINHTLGHKCQRRNKKCHLSSVSKNNVQTGGGPERRLISAQLTPEQLPPPITPPHPPACPPHSSSVSKRAQPSRACAQKHVHDSTVEGSHLRTEESSLPGTGDVINHVTTQLLHRGTTQDRVDPEVNISGWKQLKAGIKLQSGPEV